MNDTKYVGIDFGTTNCCISYTQYHPQQKYLIEPQIIEINGHPTVQNTLVFGPDPRTLVALGEDVYESQAYLQYPEHVASEYKLRLDEPESRHYAAIMFGELHQSLLRALNIRKLDPNKHQVVIGVPAQWSAEENRNVVVAAAEAGFVDASPVPEPLGAMLYHTYTGEVSFESNPEYDLVLDFGGGTTDFVILQMAQHWPTPRVVRVYGEKYGGRDFDQAIMTYLRNRFWRGQNWSPRNEVQLGLFARRFKERFSTAVGRGAPAYEQMCGLPRFESMVRLSRDDFEGLSVAGDLLSRFSMLIEKGLQRGGLAPQNFRRIILSGGSSRWYFVEDKLRQYFTNAVLVRSAIPEQTISKGLALYLADPNLLLARPAPPVPISTNLEPVTPFQELQRQSVAELERSQNEVSAMPATVQGSERTHKILKWGGMIWLVGFLLDWIPGTGVPVPMPDISCACLMPIWLFVLGISYFLDKRDRNQST